MFGKFGGFVVVEGVGVLVGWRALFRFTRGYFSHDPIDGTVELFLFDRGTLYPGIMLQLDQVIGAIETFYAPETPSQLRLQTGKSLESFQNTVIKEFNCIRMCIVISRLLLPLL